MNNFLRYCFFILIVRPILILLLGFNVRHRHRLPTHGPAIIVANHNSHLDTMVLITLFPLAILKKVRPVAAADYFLTKKWLAWFSEKIIGILPIKRNRIEKHENIFANIQQCLNKKNIIIYFPEGSRGEPEQMSELKKGIAHLAKDNPTTPIYPIFMRGLGKALPKNEALLVPFVVDVIVGEPLYFKDESKHQFMTDLSHCFSELKKELIIPEW